jgi:hypothetical protein
MGISRAGISIEVSKPSAENLETFSTSSILQAYDEGILLGSSNPLIICRRIVLSFYLSRTSVLGEQDQGRIQLCCYLELESQGSDNSGDSFLDINSSDKSLVFLLDKGAQPPQIRQAGHRFYLEKHHAAECGEYFSPKGF